MTIVANQLGAAAGAALRAANARIEVIDADDTPAWELSHRAEVLFTAPRNGWFTPPAQRPSGWPGALRWVHTASVGMDFYPEWLYDVPQVTCGRGVAAVPIAEYVLAAVLDHEKRLSTLAVHSAAPWLHLTGQVPRLGLLQGKTIGLVGYGAIGREVARRARAFGMKVLALRRRRVPIEDASVEPAGSLHDLLSRADHIVLAVPLTPDTTRLIDAAALAAVRPGAHLVNIARGKLLDQAALLAALDDGRLSGATLDVTDPEPLPEGHPLYHHPEVRITPHVSWAAGDVLERSTEKFQQNLQRYLAGVSLQDVVDPSVGY